MKRLFSRVRKTPARPVGGDDAGYFSSMFHEMPGDVPARASWSTRAVEVDARALDPKKGAALFARLWADDKQLVALTADELQRLCRHCEFVSVPAGKEVIAQDEHGNYMLVVLEGSLSVDRVHPWGARARLAEAHAGEMLGEMSLLDAGARFSSCMTLSPCSLAVIDAQHLDEMLAQEPRLGLALLASLSRRLSLRLRQVSARLSALLSQN